MKGPKETFYDERIAALMDQVIAACQERGIPMFATFDLDDDGTGDPLRCTTALYGPNYTSADDGLIIRRCAAVIWPPVVGLTITKRKD